MNRRDALAALIAMPGVARITAATLEPDDVLVFECDCYVTQEQAQFIRESAERIWPGRRAIVLDKDVRLKVTKG